MAVLTREELMEKLRLKFGEESDDDSLSFIEDITDTYDDLNARSNAEALDEMTAKYEELKTKYRERFFNSEKVEEIQKEDEAEFEIEDKPEITRFEDLFEEVK